MRGAAAAVVVVPGTADDGCLGCHAGIEEMHPWEPISCTGCHGGNGAATGKDDAHVAPRLGWYTDERVLQPGFDPAAVRFRNPSDLRVAGATCGACHAREVERLGRSLHGTTAGHLSDGLYENGLLGTRESRYAVFATKADEGATPAEGGAQDGERAPARLDAIERLRVPGRPATLGDHFADLPRKACMQCHLWSQGVALPGRLGQDGLYRGAGCAACHVTYAEDGRSRSADASADRAEPGHPLRHVLTDAPPVSTCTSCHVGDAAIGNGFRGLAQLYPQMPAGPDVPNTTDHLVAGQFFIKDPLLTPPDLHFAAGLACIDCHTGRDVMGDGQLHGAMEHAVEVECSSCHGTFEQRSDGRTARGRPLPGLERAGELFVLTGKVDGRAHRVKQARDVIDPEHPDFNPRAAAAMTKEHERLECYACHAGWNTDFFGFHFDRNLAFTQLDLITGQRTAGRVTTQERVFATLRQFTLGVNPEGMIAPYLVGFSSMGTVHGPGGELLLDQALPVTAAGLSGMTMIHHQLHTTQPVARSCVECHRSPSTWGLGTGDGATSSFALARGLLVVVGERGLDTLLLDRVNPDQTLYLARLPLGGARRVVLDADPLTGRAGTAFVVVENAGIAVVDLSNPAFPRVEAFAAAGDARDAALAGDLLVVANGVGGVRVLDVSDRRQPRLLSDLVTSEARGVAVQWPRVLVADGPGGLLIADISVPAAPRITGQVRLAGTGSQEDGDANAVAALFQYGRPQGPEARTEARLLVVVADGIWGPVAVDATEPEASRLLTPISAAIEGGARAVDVTLTGRYDLGDTSGARPTVERDVACVLITLAEDTRGLTAVLDVTDPAAPKALSRIAIGQGTDVPPVGGGALVRSFNPPELVTRHVVAGEGGLLFQDVTRSEAGVNGARLPGVAGARDVAAEAFAFDRMLDETGRQLKDISHAGARFLDPAEIHRVLSVPGEALGTLHGGGDLREGVAQAYGDRAVPGGSAAASRNLYGKSAMQTEEMLQRLAGGFRIAAKEDLARMVRHVDPRAFDDNRDAALSRGELERLVFAVLDANGDGRLDALEWPRHPGAEPAALDRDHDGSVSRAEMDLGDDVLRFFDTSGDGLAQFSEWPFTVDDRPLPTLFYATVDYLARLVARIGFDKERPDLYVRLAGPFQKNDIPPERLQQEIDRARANPLVDPLDRAAPPAFIDRWDIDGDGAVDAQEYPALPRIADRCDRNGDGRIDRADRP